MTNTLYCDDYKKQCPVCGAFTFENARLCYGCMYRFNDDASVNMHSLTATGTSSLERVSEPAPTSLPAATGAFDSLRASTSLPADTSALSSSPVGTGVFASPSVEIGACDFSRVSAAPPVASPAAMSASAAPLVAPPVPASALASPPVAPSAAMGASVYTCVPATTSTDAYAQHLPCEPGNCFSSYKTY